MFNSKKPSLEELPSSAQLLRSTITPATSAVAILVTVVLPAEYGIEGLCQVVEARPSFPVSTNIQAVSSAA